MIILLLAAAANAVVAPVPKDATFGNWTVACDNVRYCGAFALPDAEAGDGVWVLSMTRRPEAAAAPRVEAYPAYSDGDVAAATLRIDGRATDFRLDGQGALQGNGAALLAAIATARKVEVLDPKGKVVGTVPVTGASATLRWIDAGQKRVRTVTAIVAKGARTAVPPPPPLPRIVQPPASKIPAKRLSRADVRAIRQLANDYCDRERPGEVETHRLDARHSVGIVGCMMGAYQGASLIVVIDESGHWVPATIEQPRTLSKDAEPADPYLLTSAEYDPKTRLLAMYAKGRGIGDCGETASWTWDGKMFRLASFQALDACLGAPPGMWLSRWQTANDPLKDE
jgi:hypothetical protein